MAHLRSWGFYDFHPWTGSLPPSAAQRGAVPSSHGLSHLDWS